MLFDHPTKPDRQVSSLQSSLANQHPPLILAYDDLHYLHEVVIFGFIAFGLGLDRPPITKQEVEQFKQTHLAQDRRVLIKDEINNISVFINCALTPIRGYDYHLTQRIFSLEPAPT